MSLMQRASAPISSSSRRELDEIVLVVDGSRWYSERVASTLSTVLLGGLDGLLQIAHVVERVENADDVDAVFDGTWRTNSSTTSSA